MVCSDSLCMYASDMLLDSCLASTLWFAQGSQYVIVRVGIQSVEFHKPPRHTTHESVPKSGFAPCVMNKAITLKYLWKLNTSKTYAY